MLVDIFEQFMMPDCPCQNGFLEYRLNECEPSYICDQAHCVLCNAHFRGAWNMLSSHGYHVASHQPGTLPTTIKTQPLLLLKKVASGQQCTIKASSKALCTLSQMIMKHDSNFLLQRQIFQSCLLCCKARRGQGLQAQMLLRSNAITNHCCHKIASQGINVGPQWSAISFMQCKCFSRAEPQVSQHSQTSQSLLFDAEATAGSPRVLILCRPCQSCRPFWVCMVQLQIGLPQLSWKPAKGLQPISVNLTGFQKQLPASCLC